MIIEGDLDRAIAATLHSPFSSAFEQAERELGEAIGYPALVYESGAYHAAQASAGYVGVFQSGDELSVAETAARLNALERENAGLRAANKTGVENLENAMAIEVALRLQLASAHEHVGALTSAIAQARTTEDAFMRDATRRNMRAAEDAEASLIIAENAARTWLRQ